MLYPYIWSYKYLIFSAFVSLTVAATVMLVVPLTIRHVIDYSFSCSDSSAISSCFSKLLLLALILGFASATRYYSVITLGERIVSDLRQDIFAHLVTLPASFYDRSHSGTLLSLLISDTTIIKSVIGATTSIMLRNIITVIGAIAMMVVTSPKLSVVVLFFILIALLPLIGLGRRVRLCTRMAQDELARVNALASEQLAAIRTVQAFNAQPFILAQFSNLTNLSLYAIRQSILLRSFLTGLAIFLVFGSVISVLWIGSQDVLNGHMSSGTLGQFILYAIFTAGSFGQLSEVGGEFAQATGAAERLSELLNEKPDIQISPKMQKLPEPPQGHLDFDNVSFAYPSSCSGILSVNQLSFSVNRGETVAIVGPSGAGKSTVFSLLLRFYDPKKGKITIDGVNLQCANLTDIRTRIAYVSQDIAIFDGTLRQNIAFGKVNIKSGDVENAARLANAYDFITPLKDGFESQIGERGLTLSGGQKQRIAIARAILRDAPILLLDEATSALDAESETLVQSALSKLMKNRTTLVIAHRLATVVKADRILVMDKGKIVEQGTHDSLIMHGGLYTRLAKLQFSS